MKSAIRKKVLRKVGSITLDILQYLCMCGEGFLLAFDPKEAQRVMKYGDFETHRFFDQLRSMDRRGYIKLKKANKQYSVTITRKGKIKLLENKKDKTADGKWRMLSFDIPEKMRVQRNLFRRSIRRVGYRQVQKSLWVCPYNKADEIDLLIYEYNLKPYVVYLLVEKTDCDQYLKDLFDDTLNPPREEFEDVC